MKTFRISCDNRFLNMIKDNYATFKKFKYEYVHHLYYTYMCILIYKSKLYKYT